MTDETLIPGMTPEYAAQNATEQLVQLTKQYRAAQPPSERPLTPEQVEQRLVTLKAAYDQQNKPEPDPVTGTLPPQPFETTTWPRTTVSNKLDTAAYLSDLGVPVDGIKAIIDGEPYGKANAAAARQWRNTLLQNPRGELAQLILSGDPDAKRVLVGMSHLIATEADAK
jgi:hypothetical protein